MVVTIIAVKIEYSHASKYGNGAGLAILTTEAAPQPDKKTGRLPAEEERAKWQRVSPS